MLHYKRKLANDRLKLVARAEADRVGKRVVEAQKTGAQATGASAIGAEAIGTLLLGAFAIGALAIGAVAVGRLAVGRARIRKLEIDELVVRKRRITEELQSPSTTAAPSPPSTRSTSVVKSDDAGR